MRRLLPTAERTVTPASDDVQGLTCHYPVPARNGLRPECRLALGVAVFRGLQRALTQSQMKAGRHAAPRFKRTEFGSYAFLRRRRRISPNPARAEPNKTRLAGSGTT